MPKKYIDAKTIKDAVQQIIPYLEDTSNTAYKAIYFDGWGGLAASSVLRTIAEEPPPSLKKIFDRIIHIDCSRWKSRRALQRTIAEQLKLPPQVMSALDRQDNEDDFSAVDEGSRAEVANVTRETFQAIRSLSCLVIFHNGSDNMVDFTGFGFPLFNWFSPNILLWTFRGRLRLNKEIIGKVDSSHMFLESQNLSSIIYSAELREIVLHTQYKEIITTETVTECLAYMTWLNTMGHDFMDYNWETQASNYWVCDGIIQEDQFENPWEVSAALHQELRIEDCFSWGFYSPRIQQWQAVNFCGREYISPNITLYFFATKITRDIYVLYKIEETKNAYAPLPRNLFQKSERLRVLKLSGCRFSFYSPPFCCCRGLRFLALDHGKDLQQEKDDEERKQGRPAMEFFQSLWVLDINQTDWEVDFSPDAVEKMAENIRDVHIREGRIWGNNLAWRQLQNIRKLRVINPTSSWETGNKDEFNDLVKLELLDLSGNITIQALPSLSGATSLKTLVLDGCFSLEHVGAEELPPSLESFSFNARSIPMHDRAKLSKISLAGCVHLKSFLLCGAFPVLEELNLSETTIEKLDLSGQMVEVPRLKKIFLMGCRQLRAILWWKDDTRKLKVLRIDTLGTNEDIGPPYSVFVVAGDPRFIQSLMYSPELRVLIVNSFHLDLHAPPSSSIRSPSCTSSNRVIAKPCFYNDVLLEGMVSYDDEIPWPPPSDQHADVGEGISLTDAESDRANKAIATLKHEHTHSLHVHDNSRMLNIMPKLPTDFLVYDFVFRWCRVERCPKLQAVFTLINNRTYGRRFDKLEKMWASDLLMAYCIWSKGFFRDYPNFVALRTIHVHNCPRLKFVLPFSSKSPIARLEALHITHCSDLRQVFVWDDNVPREYTMSLVKEFPKLKRIHLHDLPNLQEICAARMSAPKLESVMIRGCWSLRRLPAVVSRRGSNHRPVVHCEKDCWEKLKWDGLHAGHHPSMYQHYSSVYYKKRLLRGTVLR